MFSCIQALISESAVVIMIIANFWNIHPIDSCCFFDSRPDPDVAETLVRSRVEFITGELTFGDPLGNVVFGRFRRLGKEQFVSPFPGTNNFDECTGRVTLGLQWMSPTCGCFNVLDNILFFKFLLSPSFFFFFFFFFLGVSKEVFTCFS